MSRAELDAQVERISGEIGWKKTAVYLGLVVVLSTITGFGYGVLIGYA